MIQGLHSGMNDEIGRRLVVLPMAQADGVVLAVRDERTEIGFCRVSQYVGDRLEVRLTSVRRVDASVETAVAVVTEIGIEHELIFAMAAEGAVVGGEALGTRAAERAHVLIRLARYIVGIGRRRRKVEMVGIVIGCGRPDLRQLVGRGLAPRLGRFTSRAVVARNG